MKKLIALLLCGILLALCCACQETEPEKLATDSSTSENSDIVTNGNLDDFSDNIKMDSEGMYFTRYYSLEEFSSIVEGKSTEEDILALFPGESYFALQGGHHSTIVYPLEDGRTIGFRIDQDDLVVNITFDEEPIRVITNQEP